MRHRCVALAALLAALSALVLLGAVLSRGHDRETEEARAPAAGGPAAEVPVVEGARVAGTVPTCSSRRPAQREPGRPLPGAWRALALQPLLVLAAGALLALPLAGYQRWRPVRQAAARKAFLTDASHQLRGPLQALRLRLENLEPHLADEGRPGLEHVLSEADRMSRILSALLTMARSEGRHVPVRPFDALAVVRERAAAWRPEAEERKVTLEVTGEAVVAAAVPGALDQILDVFLDNALALAPPRSRVRLSVRAEGRHVRVSCRDEGPGMSEAERRHACERFWRGSDAAPGEGSGLGLAIASSLARAGNGRLTLDAAPGGGLEAAVRLRLWARGLH